jgi:hypothetical protein
VLEAVLGDRIACPASLCQPAGHLRGALAHWVQVASRDHQQRNPTDAVIIQPVAYQRTALECRRLNVVQGDGDRSVAGAGAVRPHGPPLLIR